MRKLFLTMVIALSTLIASAQFTVVSNFNMPEDGESLGIDNFTSNVGIGYECLPMTIFGVNKNGDDFDVFMRRTFKQTLCGEYFFFAQAPTEDMFDNIRVGIAHSFYFYKNFFLNPGYSVDLSGFDNGDFNIGISYKF
jgi:hypothetical protein